MHPLGTDWFGMMGQGGRGLLLSAALVLAAGLARAALRALVRLTLRSGTSRTLRVRSWTRRGGDLLLALAVASGLLSIWFEDPMRLATALSLVGAGLALALHRVVTALAGHVAIRHGNAFAVGDRISMGGMRGDVLVDLRNVYNPAEAEKAGMTYYGVGRGVAGAEAPLEQKVA